MTKYVKYIIMAVVKVIIILQRIVQMYVWNSNENSETEKGKTAAHAHTRLQIHMRAYTHAHRRTNLYKTKFMEYIF